MAINIKQYHSSSDLINDLMSLDDSPLSYGRSTFLLKAIAEGNRFWLYKSGDCQIIAAEIVGWKSTHMCILYSGCDKLKELRVVMESIKAYRADRVFAEIDSHPTDVEAMTNFPGITGVRVLRPTSYVIDLAKYEQALSCSKNHRRNINKGARNVELVNLSRTESVDEHLRMIDLSYDRRISKGQSVAEVNHRKTTELLLDSGLGKLYQGAINGEVASSIQIVTMGRCSYYVMGGSSPDGMKLGASHYMMSHAIEKLKENQDIQYFTMGIANRDGLIRYKESFGAFGVPVTNISFSGTGSTAPYRVARKLYKKSGLPLARHRRLNGKPTSPISAL